MNQRPRSWATMVVVTLLAATALAACSSTPAGPTATLGPGSTATMGPGATVVPTVAPTTSASKALPAVDLVFSGTLNFVAKGTAGQCPSFAPGAGRFFSFGATEADYPGLGQSFSMGQIANTDYVDLKWLVGGNVIYTRGSTSPVVVLSADKTSIRIDGALAGPATNGPESISGTITCP